MAGSTPRKRSSEAALAKLRSEEAPGLEAMIDHEFEAYCALEGDDRISLAEILEATSVIPGSMASEFRVLAFHSGSEVSIISSHRTAPCAR